MTPHNQGPGRERKPSWLSHTGRGPEGSPQPGAGEGGRSSWYQLPEAFSQQTQAGSVLSCGSGWGLELSWIFGLRSGSAAPEIPFLPDSEVPRVQPGWAGAAPASSRTVRCPLLHGVSELRVLRMGLEAWEEAHGDPLGLVEVCGGKAGRPTTHTHTGCCHRQQLPTSYHGDMNHQHGHPFSRGGGGQAAASSPIFQVRTQVHRGKGLVWSHTAGEQQGK